MVKMYWLVLLTLCSVCRESLELNNRPIIGVLSQELTVSLQKYYANYTSYIAASYVKILEGAGARVAPIFINQKASYYQNLFASINGILFPGGAVWLDDSGFGHAGKVLYDLAVKANQNGYYFPLWGTCLGFELISYLEAGGKEHRCWCNSWNQAKPLKLEEGALRSRMLEPMPSYLLASLVNKPVTVNFHHKCITKKNFTDFGLDKKLRILSTNKDSNGLEFISAYESIDMPFYGVQFHPEKNIYEWNTKEDNLPHFSEAIAVSQYFAAFYVNEARKNNHTFLTPKQEAQALIDNYPTTYTALKGITFDECYLFKQ